MGNELTVQQRAAVALGSSEHEKALVALADKHRNITAITNPAGREDAHSAMMELKRQRTDLERRGKDARDDANAFAKAVIAEEKRLVAIIEPEEKRLLALRDAWDAAREAERQAKIRAEQQRIDTLRARVQVIRDGPALFITKSSAVISDEIARLDAIEIGDDFQEFAADARAAVAEARTRMGEILVKQLETEAEAERLIRERAELERLRQEQAAREKAEAAARAEREAAERKAREAEEQERRAREKAEFDRQQAELRVRQEAIEQQEREAAERRARERMDREAEEARLAAERQRLADEANAVAERERQALLAQQALQDRKERNAAVMYEGLRAVRVVPKLPKAAADIIDPILAEIDRDGRVTLIGQQRAPVVQQDAPADPREPEAA